jgi:hypothetical protein
MNNFKDFLTSVVNEVASQNAVEELRKHSLEDMFEILDNTEQAINVLAMNNIGDRRKVDDEGKVTYLVQRGSASPKELWNGKLTHTMYASDEQRLLATERKPKAKSRAVIRSNVKHGSSYIEKHTNKSSSTTYTSTQILSADGKTPIYTSDAKMYTVTNFKVYKMAVVLDITPVDSFSSKKWFDDEILGLQKEGIDHSRDEQDESQNFMHLVFRYAPLTSTGKPNPYCGLTQLKNWLKSQDFIQRQAPATLKDALEILKGSTISIPNAMYFNYSTKSDLLTVYTVYGDFDHFTESFEPQTKQEYHSISEFILRDLDSETSESLNQEVYAKISTKITPILTYDCHKEFSTQLGLEYNHIGSIFD